jgi:RNA polymerase sigma-70 factor (ECF subfamily)
MSTSSTLDPGVLMSLLDGRERFVAYVARRLGDPSLAEDVVQDSLLRALRAAPSLRDEERIEPWFYRVLQNAITDTYRRAAVERRRLAPLAADPAEPEPEAEREACECFYGLLPSLKPEYAEVLRLDLGGEATEATAVRLGISPGNLKVRRHRARRALRQRLEEMCRLCARDHCLDCTCGGSAADEV